MRKIGTNIFLAVLAGVTGFMAFPPFGYGALAWACLIPFFILAKENKGDLRGMFLYSYLAGVVFFGGLLYWLVNVTVPGTIAVVLFLALYYGLFGAVTAVVFKYSLEILILPFVWVLIEYLRSHIFTGFPWGLLAYSQYENIKFIQLADLFGSYGISFMLAFFNAALFSLFDKKNRRFAPMVAAVFLLLVSEIYGTSKLKMMDDMPEGKGLKVSVIQGNIPQVFKFDPEYAENNIREYADLTRAAAKGDPDLIVWPETAYPYSVDPSSGVEASEITALARAERVPILAGIVSGSGEEYYNSAFLYSDEGDLIAKYSKTHLVPFGEYIPLGKYLAPIRDYIDKPIGEYSRGSGLTLFPIISAAKTVSGAGSVRRTVDFYKFGVLICFEDIFPELAREFVKDGANFLVNITNDAWFGDTAAAEQHLGASVFRAVENRVPVVRAANTGVSCFIDAVGRVTNRVKEGDKDIFVKGYAADTVRIGKLRSVYTYTGDAFVFSAALLVLFSFIFEKLMMWLAARQAKTA